MQIGRRDGITFRSKYRPKGFVLQGIPQQLCGISNGGVVVGVVQTSYIFIMGTGHSQLTGFLVHEGDEGFLCP